MNPKASADKVTIAYDEFKIFMYQQGVSLEGDSEIAMFVALVENYSSRALETVDSARRIRARSMAAQIGTRENAEINRQIEQDLA